MDDAYIEKNLEDVEEEIDSAFDQLFVGTIPPEPQAKIRRADAGDSSVSRDEAIKGDSSRLEGETERAESIKEIRGSSHEKYERLIDKLSQNVTAFKEWGVTEAAIEKVLSGVNEIRKAYAHDAKLKGIISMVIHILEILKKNPTVHERELIAFIVGALDNLKELIQLKEKGDSLDADVLNILKTNYSKVLSLLSYTVPGSSEPKGVSPEKEKVEGAESAKETEERKIQNQTEEEIVDLGASLSEPKSEFREKTAQYELETFAPEKFVPEFHEENLKPEQRGEKQDIASQDQKGFMFPPENLNSFIDELFKLIQRLQRTFFETHSIIEIVRKLYVDVDKFKNLLNRILPDIPDSLFLRDNTEELHDLFLNLKNELGVLLRLIDPKTEEEFEIEEIAPVFVGKKVIGIRSQNFEIAYSITQEQEKRFKEKGFINLKGERIPFVDLIREYRETSITSDKRLLILNFRQGKKALLVDRILKKRFALIAKSEKSGAMKVARFYTVEEVPIYEAI